MKHTFVLAFLSVSACLFALSCEQQDSGGSATTGPTGGGGKRIAVIPKGTTHVFWKTVEAGVRDAGKELGVTVTWQGPLKEDDRGQQIGLVEQFISNNVDGIVLAPLDAPA
jgi:ribose transport system substrate-binding protein